MNPSPLDTLRQVTAALAAIDGRSVPEVLATVWRGLEQAAFLGAQLAAIGDNLRLLQRNARTVEIALHKHLRASASEVPLCLPTPPADLAPIERHTGAAAVAALIDYAETARRTLLAGVEHAAGWEERRPCGHGSHLCGELAAAWRGLRPDYQP